MLSIILLLLSLTTCALRNPIGMTFGHTALDPLLRKLSIILLMAIIDKTNFSQPARRELHPRYARPFAVRFVDNFAEQNYSSTGFMFVYTF